MNPKKEKITPSQNAMCADRLDALRVAGDAAQVCGERCGAGWPAGDWTRMVGACKVQTACC